jgi:hypothetical protein
MLKRWRFRYTLRVALLFLTAFGVWLAINRRAAQRVATERHIASEIRELGGVVIFRSGEHASDCLSHVFPEATTVSIPAGNREALSLLGELKSLTFLYLGPGTNSDLSPVCECEELGMISFDEVTIEDIGPLTSCPELRCAFFVSVALIL